MKLYAEKPNNVYLIVGLGNPGSSYSKNRHNLGFMVLDKMATEHKLSWKQSFKGNAHIADFRSNNNTIYLLKPQTYMNLSGRAVAPFAEKKYLDYKNIAVVHDDLDLTFGKIRLKRGGGDGGHRGVRSIADSLRFKDFIRVRIGVGRPPEGITPEVFVLKDFYETTELENLEQVVCNGVSCIMVFVEMGLEKAQQEGSALSLRLPKEDMVSD